MTATHSRITGTGSFLPPRRVSNQDLVDQLAARGLESSDDWIVERTGIRARHFVDDGIYSSDLALAAWRPIHVERLLWPGVAGAVPNDTPMAVWLSASSKGILTGVFGVPRLDPQAMPGNVGDAAPWAGSPA